jgi:hypothetical protein
MLDVARNHAVVPGRFVAAVVALAMRAVRADASDAETVPDRQQALADGLRRLGDGRPHIAITKAERTAPIAEVREVLAPTVAFCTDPAVPAKLDAIARDHEPLPEVGLPGTLTGGFDPVNSLLRQTVFVDLA